jgi:hypothetical protein
MSRVNALIIAAIMALVALSGALKIHSEGLDRIYGILVLVVCGFAAVNHLFYVIRPPRVLELDATGVRIPRRGTIPWSEVSRMRIYLVAARMQASWLRFLNPFHLVTRRAFRSLGLVPKQGSVFDLGRTGRWRQGGAVPIAVALQLPMKLEELVSQINTFAPELPLEYGPRAEPHRR